MTMLINKIVLAYSGGLDTSVMISWLKENYHAEIIAVICDLGQEEDLQGIQQKALKSGASKAFLLDVQSEFITHYLFPMLKSSALYEDQYLLGTISRSLIAQKLVEIAKQENAEAIAHGATGKGNDQVRIEYAVKALAPELKIIAPWREWTIRSRQEAIAYAQNHGIEIPVTPKAPYSRDRNIWYVSHEGGVLEDPSSGYPDDLLLMTNSIEAAPEESEVITVDFANGIPVGINGENLSSIQLIQWLNKKAGAHGIGVVDMVENRLVGMKCRGVYEFPAGMLLHKAHKILESLCLDRATLHLKQSLQQSYANMIYEGRWFSLAKEALDAFVNKTQQNVTGQVKLKLYKGHALFKGVTSPHSLYHAGLATFEEDEIFNQADASGFINIYSLPAMLYGLTQNKQGIL
ncbi:argininosuccinate synthase [Candidatus Berkiella aquae]|uniref:Argininosuccinate synthase n=2 Tax=Candidatus Berkiella aquae TaxID=295108 RepID=A0AAE3HY57_9GAMM|nr:argininosuccinate synthase [Candidatus Berkiella aquae]MCS5711921.1 argininosuccinate synthase [Candidatus Berkiella aquae]